MTKQAHIHTYNAQGKITCCSQEEKIYTNASLQSIKKTHHHDKDGHTHDEKPTWTAYLPAIISFTMLVIGIILDNYLKPVFFQDLIRIIWYSVAYFPVGFPVIKDSYKSILKKEIFTEFTLMVLATVGAFAIGEYTEAVAVMLFYAVGELFQSAAVNNAQKNIKALLDVRPTVANVFRNNTYQEVKPETVEITEIIQIKVGERVPLDGIMLTEKASFNIAALTGESKPKTIEKGEQVLAGTLNLEKVVELTVNKKFTDSALSRILDMVQNATSKKAPTELLIRKFAKIYTPIVFSLALALIIIPYFIVPNYIFNEWLYRSLVFLVISCPCALVISIPLSYFGGIGAASKNGILFKGSNFLDIMTRVNTIVLDKTGTLTKGVFKVQKVVYQDIAEIEFVNILVALEKQSTHPIAKALVDYAKNQTNNYTATEIEEIAGYGLKGKVNNSEVLAGNTKLLKKFNISYDLAIDNIVETIVVIAIDNKFVGYALIADEIKDDAHQAIKEMRENGISKIVMLSGDKNALTQKIAQTLEIDSAFGDLLPENKVQKLEELKKDKTKIIAFVGDGINDSPVLALSDVGIAMGEMGSDVAIETASIVLQTDQPSKIVTAIKISKATQKVVIQNISLAFLVKILVLLLGASGLATMWEAVFADVGVALLAILNAVRIQKMNFDN